MNKKCKHDWVRSGYRNDLICTKCGYAAMQATMTMPVTAPMVEPMAREKVEVPFFDGSKHTRTSVYKDELEKELIRSIGLDITHNVMQSSRKNSGW